MAQRTQLLLTSNFKSCYKLSKYDNDKSNLSLTH